MADKLVMAAKPAPGRFSSRLAAAMKARRWDAEHVRVHCEVAQPDTFKYGPYVVTVLGVKDVMGALLMQFSVTLDGKPVNTNPPHASTRPPVRVPDGTHHTETRQKRVAPGVMGKEEFAVPNYVEDPKLGLRVEIQRAMKAAGLKWLP